MAISGSEPSRFSRIVSSACALQAVCLVNMSWQTYVDDHLLVPLPNGGQLSHAAIVGQDGGVWAQDAGFPAISVDQVQALVKGCNDTSVTPGLLQSASDNKLHAARLKRIVLHLHT